MRRSQSLKTLGWSVPDRTVRAKAYSDSMWLREQRRPVWLSEVGMGGEASRRRRQGPDPEDFGFQPKPLKHLKQW